MIVLKREPGGLPEYMTLHPEYSIGNAFCAWSSDREIAFQFGRERDAEEFRKKFHHWFPQGVSVGVYK